MFKPILAASALALMATTPALAQSAQPQTEPSAKMERNDATVKQPSDAAHDMKAGAPHAKVEATAAEKPAVATSGDWLASNLIGKAIVNAANESIGDVNDLLINGEGKISAVIVGVGGFLGIGEKDVALPFSSLNITPDGKGNTVIMSKATKASLESMPQWKAPSKM